MKRKEKCGGDKVEETLIRELGFIQGKRMRKKTKKRTKGFT